MKKLLILLIGIILLINLNFVSSQVIYFHEIFNNGTQGVNNLYYVNGTSTLKNMTFAGGKWVMQGAGTAINYTFIKNMSTNYRIQISPGDGGEDYGEPYLRYIVPSNVSYSYFKNTNVSGYYQVQSGPENSTLNIIHNGVVVYSQKVTQTGYIPQIFYTNNFSNVFAGDSISIGLVPIDLTPNNMDGYFNLTAINYTAELISTDTINLSAISPINNYQFNSGIDRNINLTMNNTYLSQCNITLNSIFNKSQNYTSGVNNQVTFLLNLSERNSNITLSCFDNVTSESKSTSLWVDSVIPSISSSVESNSTSWFDFLNFSINVTDSSSLYYFNLSNSQGYTYNNNSITSIFYLNQSINVLNCSLGIQQVNITVCDGFFSPINCINRSYYWNSLAGLNVTALYGLDNSSLSNFSISVNNSNYGTTSGGVFSIVNLTSFLYNISIDKWTYALDSALVNITNKTQSYQFSIYNQNSVYITIKDEDTGIPITQNVTATFTYSTGQFANTTNTSTLYNYNLNPETYSITLSSYGYSNRVYGITIGNRTSQNLNAFLTTSTATTIFNVMDQDSFESIVNASASMYRIINGSWSSVESKYTDITGRVQFTYVPLTSYKFYLSKTGYNDNVFYLNPVLFSSYDIKMDKDILLNYSQDYDGLNIIYAPNSFNNNALNTFNFIISSPVGSLVYYGYNLSYPGGSNITYGTNALGEQLSSQINITNATVIDFVRLDYYYFTTISGLRNFTVNMPINFVSGSGSNNTLLANKDKTYGMGAFERVLICTLIIIFVVGIASMVGKPVPGIVVGLFLFGYLSFIGFIELWAILPSMFIGFIFVVWKSGGY